MTQRSADSTVEWLIGEIIRTHRAKILSCYDELLARAHSPLITGELARDLHQQAAAVLAEVCARLTAADPPPPGYPQSSAKRGGPELLWAAGALCEAVLITVTEQLPDRPGLAAGVLRLAILLHQTTTHRVTARALDYPGYLGAGQPDLPHPRAWRRGPGTAADPWRAVPDPAGGAAQLGPARDGRPDRGRRGDLAAPGARAGGGRRSRVRRVRPGGRRRPRLHARARRAAARPGGGHQHARPRRRRPRRGTAEARR